MRTTLQIIEWLAIVAGFVFGALALKEASRNHEISAVMTFWACAPHLLLATIAIVIGLWSRRPYPHYALLATALPITAFEGSIYRNAAVEGVGGCMWAIPFPFHWAYTFAVFLWFVFVSLVIYSVAQICRAL